MDGSSEAMDGSNKTMDGSSHKERSSVTQEALHNLEAIQYKVISVVYQ